ncbi:MAG: hypothetical protein KatS3mg024_2628 [Armatimonadota bacterium]|nr:MAG: hypothetical protein KatS3mg024_2628 [Armatimonadota bacterium]
MKKAGWRIVAALAAAALATFARGSAAAPEVSAATARLLQDYMRPWTAPTQADPVVLFGFTCYNDPGGTRWCQMLDGGYTSLKAFGSKDPVPATYHFWYRAHVRPIFGWERSFADGREWLERERTNGMKPLQAGEGALLDEQALRCLAYRGPLYLEVSLYLDWMLKAGSDVYEWSTALRQEWPAPYLGLASPDSITAQKDAYLKEAPQVLEKLVRDILEAAPVGGGKQAQAPAATTPLLKLTATPSALWADGSGKSTIRLEARDAQGHPVKGEFPVECSRGKLSHVKLITDASGVATAQYTAPAEGPGEDTVVVRAPDGSSAKVSVTLGGILLKPAGGELGALFGDGKSSAELLVACVNPAGKPLPGTKVKLFADERELPARGRLSSDSVTAGADGTARFAYTAPNVYSGNTAFKRGDAYITAVASVGNPPRPVRSVWRVPLYAGEVYVLEVSKPAFRRLEGFRVPAPARNGVLAGTVLARMPGGQNAPLRGALLRLSSSDGTLLGTGKSDASGRFRFEFVGDRMSTEGREMELTEPLLLELEEDLMRIAGEWARDLEFFGRKGYDVSAMQEFASELPGRLAASTEGNPDRLLDTDYLAYSAMRLCALCRYLKLLDERQEESAGWFSESLKNASTVVTDTLKLSEMLRKGAQNRLKERFSPQQWQAFEESLLKLFAKLVAEQFQKGVDAAKAVNVDTEVPELFTGFGSDFLVKKGVEGFSATVKEGFVASGRSSTRRMLVQWGTRGVTGTLPQSEGQAGISEAKETLTSYEARHNRLNLDNLDRELYRLDAKLFVDTLIKGPFIYANLKKLAADPDVARKISELDVTALENIQDALKDAAEPVTNVFNAFDLMFQSYQGYQWVADFLEAERVKQQVADSIFR